jgi:hemerythrin-like domain-containing protein
MPAFPSSFPDLRAQVEAQVDFLSQVARHAVDTIEQLSDLNLRTARQMTGAGIRLGRALAACNDPIQMGALAMREVPPAAEGWRSWQGALMKVLAAGGATLAHDANDGSWQAARNAGGAANAAARAPHLIQSHRGEAMASTGTAQNGPPDALALLGADHQQLRLLFARCEDLRGLEDAEETLAELVDDLCDALIVHTMIEEELFYPALRAASGDDELFDDAELEHAGARELISQLEVMYPGDEHFEATLAVLADEVAHHIAQEETEMFALARTAGVDLPALGRRLALRQAQLEEDMSAPPTAFDAAMPHDGRRTPPRAPD